MFLILIVQAIVLGFIASLFIPGWVLLHILALWLFGVVISAVMGPNSGKSSGVRSCVATCSWWQCKT